MHNKAGYNEHTTIFYMNVVGDELSVAPTGLDGDISSR